MPTPYEIRRGAGKINTTSSAIEQENNRYYSLAGNVSSWWQGEGSKVFTQEYGVLHADIKSLLRQLRSLESDVGRLADHVQSADDARREAQRLADLAKARVSTSSRR